jgi:hypothetical protein
VFLSGVTCVEESTVRLEGMASSPEARIHLTLDEADARGTVAQITIDHPSQLNILNTALLLALTSTVNSLRAQDRLRSAGTLMRTPRLWYT